MKLLIPKCRSLYSYRDEDIVYSPNKYRETEGRKEILLKHCGCQSRPKM
uniref:Uncharacterized protein n=1 Tax=Siphoviridae sp. ct73V17 TaxID=2826302 RepID=A0A8S5M6R7_9CAUD|nr:MAG TPA: hypothetical protein [Siphoviridae sp. ct73V17]DAN66972.1 MAG TPA: hypothetical protein [Caudoviricetes sp.]